MKSINKIYAVLLTFAICIGFTACSDDDDYTTVKVPEGSQVYFPNTLSSTVALSGQETSFDVELRRIKKEESLSVPLQVKIEDPDGIFSIPTNATFTAGSDVTTITITYDPEKIEYDNYTDITLTINDQNNISAYGKVEYEFKAGIPAPWQSLGKASFLDNFTYGEAFDVEIQQHMIDPTRYRLMGPYEDYPERNVEFRILPVGSVYKDVTTTIEGLVVYDDFYAFLHPTYDAIVNCLHPSRMTNMATEDFWTYNIVKQFSADGKPEIIQLAPYYYIFGVGGWNYTQNDGMITIVLPGAVITDYSIEITYKGRYTDTDDVDHAVALVTLGEDVVSAKVALIAGSNVEDALPQILDGTIESITVNASGNVSIPCSEAGEYTFVAISFDGDDSKEIDYTTFNFQ